MNNTNGIIASAVCAKEAMSDRWFPIWIDDNGLKYFKSVFGPSLEEGFSDIETKNPMITAGDIVEYTYDPAMGGSYGEPEQAVRFEPYE